MGQELVFKIINLPSVANEAGKSVQFPETELGQRSLAMRVLLVQISASVQQTKSILLPEEHLSLLAH